MQFVYCQHCQQNIYFRPRTYGDVNKKQLTVLTVLALLAIKIRDFHQCIFFENYPPKNLEIRQFIRIFAVAFQNKEQGTKNKDLTALAFIINKPKISLTELQRLNIKVLMNLQRSFTKMKGIVRVLCVYCPCIVREQCVIYKQAMRL